MSRISSHASSTAPSRIGPWRVVGELQQWHRSATYAVSHDDHGLAALEVINAPPIKFGSYTTRLRRLMQSVNRVEHPGAITIYDAGTLPDGRPYVIREILDGVTLRARAADGLSANYAISILCDVCDVLVAAHHVGVVHGGLELGHVVLVNRELDPTLPRIKLIDWGIAAGIEYEMNRAARLGSPDVAPPQLTTADDIYAIGVMVHQMLDPIPRPLEPLWLSMLAEDARRRPSISEVAKRLAALPHAARPFVTKPYPVRPFASGTEPPPIREVSMAKAQYMSSPSLVIPAAPAEPFAREAANESVTERRAEPFAREVAGENVMMAQRLAEPFAREAAGESVTTHRRAESSARAAASESVMTAQRRVGRATVDSESAMTPATAQRRAEIIARSVVEDPVAMTATAQQRGPAIIAADDESAMTPATAQRRAELIARPVVEDPVAMTATAQRRAELITVPVVEDPVATAREMIAVAMSNMQERAILPQMPRAMPRVIPARAATLDTVEEPLPKPRRRILRTLLLAACAAPALYFALALGEEQPSTPAPAAVALPAAPTEVAPPQVAPSPATPEKIAPVAPPAAAVSAKPEKIAPARRPPAVVAATPETPKRPAGAVNAKPPAAVAAAKPEKVGTPTRQARAVNAKPKLDDRAALLAQYQRIGYDLLKLERQFGPQAVADLRTRFRWIKIDTAMATPTSRELVGTTLRDLQHKLQSKYMQECKHAPDASVCR